MKRFGHSNEQCLHTIQLHFQEEFVKSRKRTEQIFLPNGLPVLVRFSNVQSTGMIQYVGHISTTSQIVNLKFRSLVAAVFDLIKGWNLNRLNPYGKRNIKILVSSSPFEKNWWCQFWRGSNQDLFIRHLWKVLNCFCNKRVVYSANSMEKGNTRARFRDLLLRWLEAMWWETEKREVVEAMRPCKWLGIDAEVIVSTAIEAGIPSNIAPTFSTNACWFSVFHDDIEV